MIMVETEPALRIRTWSLVHGARRASWDRRSLHISGTASLDAKLPFPGYSDEPNEQNEKEQRIVYRRLLERVTGHYSHYTFSSWPR